MQFLFDFFPLILFFAAYKMADIYVATAVVMAATGAQIGIHWLRHRRFEKVHLITMGLLVVFGGATLILHDPLFLKWKPTAVNWLFAAAFLGSHFIGRRVLVERMMSQAIQAPPEVWVRLNLAWVGFFILSGVLNLYVAFNFSEEIWVNFKVFGLIGLTLLFVVAQSFYLMRHMKEDAPASAEE